MGRPTDLRVGNEERGIALHRTVADRLVENPALIGRALARIDEWLADGRIHRTYGEAWRQLLSGPLDELLGVLTRPDDHARTLRQCSPFAGVLDPQTRRRILQQPEARVTRAEMTAAR